MISDENILRCLYNSSPFSSCSSFIHLSIIYRLILKKRDVLVISHFTRKNYLKKDLAFFQTLYSFELAVWLSFLKASILNSWGHDGGGLECESHYPFPLPLYCLLACIGFNTLLTLV